MNTGKYIGYFSHDSNAKDDPKVMIMMAQMGIESYGIYWILIEFLKEQEGYEAPMILIDPIARRYGSSKEKFEAVITKFNLFEFDSDSFFSPSLKRRMSWLDNKRETMRELANKRWSAAQEVKEVDAYALPAHSVRNACAMQSKVKYSKVKYSKEEGEINSDFEIFWNLYDKKYDRKKCESKWIKLSKEDQEECIRKVPAYVRSTPEKKFRKNPDTYLNNKSWENEIIHENGNDSKDNDRGIKRVNDLWND